MTATRRINAATTWLIRAFSPGCPTLLRSWESQRATVGERLTIVFDLPDDRALARARELHRSARSLRLIAIGRVVVRDVAARVSVEHRTLKIEALLGRREEGESNGQ